ncbi:hypothetical protein ACFOET_10095 [Parapedobacter deserti]|uniref:Uncharacterized protein n=1 Tax=Parapedobacter deserti TaxID=1912957 RepID=A0ABV7JJ06_9SPHI
MCKQRICFASSLPAATECGGSGKAAGDILRYTPASNQQFVYEELLVRKKGVGTN